MSRNMEAALVLIARDEASRPVARALQGLSRHAQEAGKEIGNIGQAGAKSMYRLASDTKTAERAVLGLSRESQRMARDREQLGVRAEQAIQREIRQTEYAYQRLARSGKLSASEQARAYQAMRDKVAGLRREMQGVVEQQSRMGAAGRGVMATGSAVAAGAYVLNRPLQSIEDYDLRLRNMTNTAYADQGLAGRQAGLREIREAIRKSGGNRDASAEALDNMIASGSLGEGAAGRKAAFDMLPVVMKYATAGNANPNELVDIALKAKKTFNIANPSRVLEMALMGGQLGGFEMKDMAKWLPQQMANASMAGMGGDKGFAKLVALNQSAVIAAGSKDQAGNNVVNFLGKLNADETAGDFKKLGVNWRQNLLDGAKSGRDAVDVFGATIDGLLKKNAAYQKLQARLGTTTGDEQKATLASMAKILQGAVVGKISSDQQELMGVLAYLNNRQQQAANEKKILDSRPGDAANTSLALIRDSAAYKSQQFDNAVAEKQFDALKGLSDTVGDTKLKLVEYASEYPGLSTALVGATTALTALAAAAGAASLAAVLGGGKGGALANAASGIAARAAGVSPLLMRGGAVVLGSYAALQLAKAAGLPDVDEKQGREDVKAGNWLKASAHLSAGDFLGAMWDSTFNSAPGRRNAPNSAAPIPQAINSAATRLDQAALKVQQASNQPIPVKVTVDVQNGNIVASVNAANAQTARRH